MKDVYILGIETSCDETSIAIVKNGCIDVYTCVLTQMDTHAKFGGVVPEIASRMHTENITMVLDDVVNKSGVTWDMIDAIAVTYAPGLLGSLLVGLEFAKTLSLIHNKPLIAVNHLAGHIYANRLVEPIAFPSLGLVISGGHTELILMKIYSWQLVALRFNIFSHTSAMCTKSNIKAQFFSQFEFSFSDLIRSTIRIGEIRNWL